MVKLKELYMVPGVASSISVYVCYCGQPFLRLTIFEQGVGSETYEESLSCDRTAWLCVVGVGSLI